MVVVALFIIVLVCLCACVWKSMCVSVTLRFVAIRCSNVINTTLWYVLISVSTSFAYTLVSCRGFVFFSVFFLVEFCLIFHDFLSRADTTDLEKQKYASIFSCKFVVIGGGGEYITRILCVSLLLILLYIE